MKTAMKMIEERLRVGSAWSRGFDDRGGEEEEADEQLLALAAFQRTATEHSKESYYGGDDYGAHVRVSTLTP